MARNPFEDPEQQLNQTALILARDLLGRGSITEQTSYDPLAVSRNAAEISRGLAPTGGGGGGIFLTPGKAYKPSGTAEVLGAVNSTLSNAGKALLKAYMGTNGFTEAPSLFGGGGGIFGGGGGAAAAAPEAAAGASTLTPAAATALAPGATAAGAAQAAGAAGPSVAGGAAGAGAATIGSFLPFIGLAIAAYQRGQQNKRNAADALSAQLGRPLTDEEKFRLGVGGM